MLMIEARQERFNTIKDFLNCKLAKSSTVIPHMLEVESYLEQLQKLGFEISRTLATDIGLRSLPSSFDSYVMN